VNDEQLNIAASATNRKQRFGRKGGEELDSMPRS
jgi:hypothetical protein